MKKEKRNPRLGSDWGEVAVVGEVRTRKWTRRGCDLALSRWSVWLVYVRSETKDGKASKRRSAMRESF